MKKFYKEKDEEEGVECPPRQDDDPLRKGISNAGRRWKFLGAFLFLLLIVVGVVLGITLRPKPQNEAPDETTALREKLQEVEEHGEAHGKKLKNA